MNLYTQYLTLNNEEQIEFLNKVFCRSLIREQFYADMREHMASLDKKVYKYFVTFTTREDARANSLTFLESQASRESLKVVYFRYVIEHPEDNLHYHVEIHTLKPIEKGDFKHWVKTRGHVDFKPIKAGTEGQINSYMLKEGEPKVVVDLT